jgi:phosphopantetheinyl transferase
MNVSARGAGLHRGLLPVNQLDAVSFLKLGGRSTVHGCFEGNEISKRHAERIKELLAHRLWHELSARNLCPPPDEPLRIITSALGKPAVMAGNRIGPPISFSRSAGSILAAACASGPQIGLDSASPAEFPDGYPVWKICYPHEWSDALRITGGDPHKAASLLWSVKESFAKALGSGFHLFDALSVLAEYTSKDNETLCFKLWLNDKAREKICTFSSQSQCRQNNGRHFDLSGRENPLFSNIEYTPGMAFARYVKQKFAWLTVTFIDTPFSP